MCRVAAQLWNIVWEISAQTSLVSILNQSSKPSVFLHTLLACTTQTYGNRSSPFICSIICNDVAQATVCWQSLFFVRLKQLVQLVAPRQSSLVSFAYISVGGLIVWSWRVCDMVNTIYKYINKKGCPMGNLKEFGISLTPALEQPYDAPWYEPSYL